VAFLDVGVYVTSIRSLKNLIVIGDAVKSIWFVAFQVQSFADGSWSYTLFNIVQEDPYKLTILAKDPRQICVTGLDFFFADENLSIVSCDEEGIIRLYQYDPHGLLIFSAHKIRRI